DLSWTLPEQKWFEKHRLELQDDIRQTPHQWFSGSRQQCLEADAVPYSPIRLFNGACPANPSEQVSTLVEASLVHLGIDRGRAKSLSRAFGVSASPEGEGCRDLDLAAFKR